MCCCEKINNLFFFKSNKNNLKLILISENYFKVFNLKNISFLTIKF